MSNTTVSTPLDTGHAVTRVPGVDLPVINARRTLLIGLGSTGAMVCNQILERALWTYDTPENIPWLRSIVLETAKIPAQYALNNYAKSHHLSIAVNDYADLVANPATYKDKLDFSTWQIPQVMGNQDAITDGANNTRSLGRLAVLFESNFSEIDTLIRSELDHLKQINADNASEVFSVPYGEAVKVSLPPELYVYVVGTLCGGTASGSFIDIGYFLEYLQSTHNYPIRSTGLFTLPSTQETDTLLTANAYSALVELNHFSSPQSRYSVQYSTSPGNKWVAPIGLRPYRFLYLLQSRGATKIEKAQMITATADYIYSDVVGSTALTRDAARTNISSLFSSPDFYGATQKYMTFGLSVLEFPYAKVAKACSVRLARKGIQQLLVPRTPTELERDDFLATIPLLQRNALIEALTQRGTAGLEASFYQALSAARTDAYNSDAAITTILEQLNAAFDGNTPVPLPDLPERVVPKTIEANTDAVKLSLETALVAACRKLVDEKGYSLPAFTAMLNAIIAQLQASKKSDEGVNENVAQLGGAANQAAARASECRHDFWLGLVMQRGPAVRRYVDEFISHAGEFYGQRLRQACAPACDIILEAAEAIVAKFALRVNNVECGLLAEVQSLTTKYETLYNNTNKLSGSIDDGWSRVINGTELFDPARTVDQEYQTCLNNAASSLKIKDDSIKGTVEDQLARGTITPYLQKATAALFAPTDEIHRFDPTGFASVPDYKDMELLTFARPARKYLGALQKRSVVDRLLADPTLPNLLTMANTAAARFLDWASGPRYFDHPKKNYGYVFYNEEDPRAADFKTALTRSNIINTKTIASGIADKHQVLILREQGAFSLGTIQNLREDQASEWLNAYRSNSHAYSYHARGDIKPGEWLGWKRKDDEERVRVRNIFLVGVALGIVVFRSATEYRFNYPKKSAADPGYIEFSNDLNEVALKLRSIGITQQSGGQGGHTSRLEQDIELKINEVRASNAAAVVEKIDTFIQGSDGKFKEANQVLSNRDIDLYLIDFLSKDVELWQIYTTVLYPNKVSQSYLQPDETGQNTYFCPHCTRKLGYTSNSLYTDEVVEGKTIRTRKCNYCSEPL